jgi:hypothetical protein
MANHKEAKVQKDNINKPRKGTKPGKKLKTK